MRPSAMAAKNGSRPPATRLRTSAVMNTVLPERASPVTPSRSVGVIRSRRSRAGAPERVRRRVGQVREPHEMIAFLALATAKLRRGRLGGKLALACVEAGCPLRRGTRNGYSGSPM